MLSIDWSCVTLYQLIDLSISYDILVDGDKKEVVLSEKKQKEK